MPRFKLPLSSHLVSIIYTPRLPHRYKSKWSYTFLQENSTSKYPPIYTNSPTHTHQNIFVQDNFSETARTSNNNSTMPANSLRIKSVNQALFSTNTQVNILIHYEATKYSRRWKRSIPYNHTHTHHRYNDGHFSFV